MKISILRTPANRALRCHIWQRHGKDEEAFLQGPSIEWKVHSTNPAVMVPWDEGVQIEESELLELYHSLRDELRRIGALPPEPSGLELAAIKAHLADMRTMSVQMLSAVVLVSEARKP